MSNSLDPDQARFVGPGLGPNCLPILSADGTGRQRVKVVFNMTRVSKRRIAFVQILLPGQTPSYNIY